MKKYILSFDYYFQLTAFVLIMISAVLVFPLMLLAPFGAYQVLSAGIKGFVLNKYLHRVFALIAGLYGSCIVYLLVGNDPVLDGLIRQLGDGMTHFLGFFAYFILPTISAIFYICQSYKDWQEAVAEEASAQNFIS